MSAPMALQRGAKQNVSTAHSRVVNVSARPLHAPHVTRRQQHHICRADAGDTPPTSAPSAEQQQQPAQQAPQQSDAPKAPLLAPGQGTAIVTGAISIIFGIAYLVLVSLLDMRGGELQPPPPEAFMQ